MTSFLVTLLALFASCYVLQNVVCSAYLIDNRGLFPQKYNVITSASSSESKGTDSSSSSESTSKPIDSSSLSSSSSEEEESDKKQEGIALRKTAQEVLSYSHKRFCQSENRYLDSDGTCQPCSRCGPGRYVREECRTDRDTVCQWCFNQFPIRNEDFRAKCQRPLLIRPPQMAQEDPAESSSSSSEEEEESNEVDESNVGPKRYLFSKIRIESNNWWKVEFAMEICFYLALIALILSIIRFLSKTRSYRTVHITAPVLDEADHKNIIKAVESIRNKLGKKDYERLEEFI